MKISAETIQASRVPRNPALSMLAVVPCIPAMCVSILGVGSDFLYDGKEH